MDSQSQGRYISFILKVKEGSEQDANFNGQVIMSDGRKIGLANGSYLVRVWLEPDDELIRGTISHEQSSQQIHFQSGDRVGEFVKNNCLAHGRLNLTGEMEDPS